MSELRMHNHENTRLWTRQDIKSLEALKTQGHIRITEAHLQEKFDLISEYIAGLYRWFVRSAETRVPKPEGVAYPVWCSVSEENMLRPTEDTVVYVLEVDPSEILYFDGTKWDHVLNHMYIPEDEADAERYRKSLEAKGYDNQFSFFNEKTGHFYRREQKVIMDSWPRIFKIDHWDIFRVQANIWEIRPEMVREVLLYGEPGMSLEEAYQAVKTVAVSVR